MVWCHKSERGRSKDNKTWKLRTKKFIIENCWDLRRVDISIGTITVLIENVKEIYRPRRNQCVSASLLPNNKVLKTLDNEPNPRRQPNPSTQYANPLTLNLWEINLLEVSSCKFNKRQQQLLKNFNLSEHDAGRERRYIFSFLTRIFVCLHYTCILVRAICHSDGGQRLFDKFI